MDRYVGAVDDGGARDRSSSGRHLPHGDALAGGPGVPERRLLPLEATVKPHGHPGRGVSCVAPARMLQRRD